MTISLIVEKAKKGYFGRIEYQGDLIVANESTVAELERKILQLLSENHKIDAKQLHFIHSYDLTALFGAFDFLKISSVAKMAGLNDSLVRQYVNGTKYASLTQAKKIEEAVRTIGRKLVKVKVHDSRD